jgi:toxin ParE1/3/4
VKRRLLWTRPARRDLQAIWSYICRHDEAAARDMIGRIHQACGALEALPDIGRPGRVAGTRELIVSGTPYIVPYRVRDDAVEILAVFHGSRKWPVAF